MEIVASDAGSVAGHQLRDLTHYDNNIEALKKGIQTLALAKERLLKKIDAAKMNCSRLFGAADREIGYLLHFDNNIEALKREIQKLALAKERLLKKYDASKGNCQGIFSNFDVQIWIAEVEEISAATDMFLQDEVSANKRCMNLRQRYLFSKGAKKQSLVISDQLLEAGKLENAMSSLDPPPETISPSMGFSVISESRESVKKEIMDALTDENVEVIGICGLAGVGKTTLVKEVRQEAIDRMLYDVTVMVVVSKTPSIKNIQEEIADVLGLTLPDDSDGQRTANLSKRIRWKRILIILDDVWEEFDLSVIGFCSWMDFRKSKVVITCRSKRVCDKMGCLNIFTVPTLSKQESWELSKGLAGPNVENSIINPTAREAASKCGGLPMAIVTVARALQSKGKCAWNNAAKKLRKSDINPTTIEGMQGSLISSIELSYSYLESEEAKSLFLFCSLFPENFKIPVEVLVRYGVGLEWFQNFCTIEDARDRVHNLVSILTSSFLLTDDNDDEYGKCVKMHDAVREFALNIARKCNHIFMVAEQPSRDTCEDLTAISLVSCDVDKIPEGLDFPKLQALLLQPKSQLIPPLDLFERLKNLKALYLSKITASFPLPHSLSSLEKLRTLHVNYCKLDGLSVIGELNNLEILSFHGSNIKEIPISFRQLSHLRLLDLNKCKQLEVIPPAVTTYLRKLEELYMIDSFEHWDFQGNGDSRGNAKLSELQHLPRLTSLQICIPDSNMLPQNNVSFWFQNLINFTLVIGRGHFNCSDKSRYSRNIVLFNISISQMHEWIKKLLERTENLHLDKCDSSKNILDDLAEIRHGQLLTQSFSKLESLHVRDCRSILNIVPGHLLKRLQNLKTFKTLKCESLEYIFDLEGLDVADREPKIFSLLEDLALADLPKMTQIWKGDHEFISLCNLKRVALKNCFKLMKLFSSTLLESLICLENIEVERCNDLEEIFEQREAKEKGIAWNKDCTTTSQSLGNLTIVHVSDCFKLKNLFTASNGVKRRVKLKTTTQEVRNKKIYDNPDMVDGSYGQPPTLSFSKLKHLCVRNCSSMLNIVPSHVLEGLQNISTFQVFGCELVVDIFDLEGLENSNEETKMLSSLKYLNLEDLAEMTQIWKGDHQFISLSNLERVKLKTCPKLIKLFSPTLQPSLISLKEVEIRRCSDLEKTFEKRKAEYQEKMKKDNTTISSPSLGNLTSIFIHGCGKLKYLFTFSIAKSLLKLKSLKLYECSTIQEIVKNNEEEKGASAKRMVFPSLYRMELQDLNNLNCFSSGLYAIEFLALEGLRIFNCPKMQTFCYGDQVTPKLTTVTVAHVDPNYSYTADWLLPLWLALSPNRWKGNLNATVEQIFKEQEQIAKQTEEESHDQITTIET